MRSLTTSLLIITATVLMFTTHTKAGIGSFLFNSSLKIAHPIDSYKDVAYGSESWQLLNIYPQKDKKSAPVVIFIYGGAWIKGSKEQHHFVADGLTRKGYLVVIPDYIKYPDGKFPTFVEDIALATAWVKANIHQYGGNPEQILLAGHSAGAHTGALLVTDNRYLAAVDMNKQDIKGFVGLSGPYNFTPKAQKFVRVFGRENFNLMKVNNHVDGDEPPIKLIHSQGDKTVGQFNFDTFRNKLQAAGHDVQTKLYDRDIGHIDTVLKTNPWFAGDVDVADEIDVFFKSILP